MRLRGGLAALMAVALAGSSAACTATLLPASAGNAPVINWQSCGITAPDPYQERAAKLECGLLEVPFDYAKPNGDKAQLAVVRVKATGDRLGSLVTNPGGPGASGLQALINRYLIGSFDTLNSRYDLVSFDPRGVGFSIPPVKCLDNAGDEAFLQLDHTPQTEEQIQAFAEAERQYNKACEAGSGGMLPYVGTVSAAKDMEQLRQAIGDQKLNFFGTSYGTWLGAEYANQFPANVGRMTLDSAVDPTLSQKDLDLQQAASQQANLEALLDECVAQGEQCALHSFGATRDELLEKINSLAEQLDQKPMASGDRKLSRQMLDTGLGGAVGSANLRPHVPPALAGAFNGDPTGMIAIADGATGRQPDGSFETTDEANRAVRCADDATHYSTDDVIDQISEYQAASSTFGETAAWDGLRCLDWPVPGDNAAKDVAAPNSATTIVVIGSTGDPATPFAWSPALVSQLGNAQLITNNGPYHGAYTSGETCVQEKVNAYFLEGTLPGNVTCE